MNSLTLRIITYIKKKPDVSYEEIQQKSKEKGVTPHELTKAMSLIHKRRDIKTTQKDDTLYYTYREPKPRVKIGIPRYQWTKEEIVENNQLIHDHFTKSPLTTEEERECYLKNWKGDECEKYRTMFMTPDEVKRKREKEADEFINNK